MKSGEISGLILCAKMQMQTLQPSRHDVLRSGVGSGCACCLASNSSSPASGHILSV